MEHSLHVNTKSGGKGYTLHINTNTTGGERDTPCTSLVLVLELERNTPFTFTLPHTADGGEEYTLHVHTATLITVEDNPGTSILQ